MTYATGLPVENIFTGERAAIIHADEKTVTITGKRCYLHATFVLFWRVLTRPIHIRNVRMPKGLPHV